MKENVFGIFAALVVLAVAHNLWLHYKGTLILSTNVKAGTEVSVQYTERTATKR